MLTAAEASLSGNFLHGKMTKSSFDRTPAEGNLLGSLGEGLLQGAGLTPLLAAEL